MRGVTNTIWGQRKKVIYYFSWIPMKKVPPPKSYIVTLHGGYNPKKAMVRQKKWVKKGEWMQDGAWPSWLQLFRKPDGCSVMWTISRENAKNSCLRIIEKEEGKFIGLLLPLTVLSLVKICSMDTNPLMILGCYLAFHGLFIPYPWMPLGLWWEQWWLGLCGGRNNISCH